MRDYAAACAWYERLLGRPPDMLPHAREAVWRLTDEASLYVVADPGRAGGGLVTVAVDDLNAQLAAFAERGVEARIETLGNGMRKAVVADPDGNELGFFSA